MIDWVQGKWQRAAPAHAPDQRIIVAGDWAPIRRYRDILLSDPEAVYGDLLPPLREADLRIVNVEVSLSSRGAPIIKDGPNLQGPPATVAALTCVPFDVGCLANNHMMDYGPEALADTGTLLTEHGILTVGAGVSREDASAPLILSIGETRVGIVNFCEGEDNTTAAEGPGVFGWECGTVLAQVCEMRAHVDLLLVIAHAGREYTPAPPSYIQRAYRAIAEAGADAVIGHHPHAPQGIEIYANVPIVYSLGNFVFDQNTLRLFQRCGYMVQLGVTDREVSELKLIPYMLTEKGLRQMRDNERKGFLADLRAVSEPLASSAKVAALWHAYIDSWGEAFWTESCAGLASLLAQVGAETPGAADLHEEAELRNVAKLRAVAKLRNRFITPAHRHFIADGMTRLIDGALGTAPAWAVELVARWAREAPSSSSERFW